MSFLITAAVIGTGLLTADAQNKAGQQAQYNLETQAEQEKLSAQGEEVNRRKRLNQVLAASTQAASASGIQGEGTPQSIAIASAKNVASSENVASLSDKLRQDLLKRQGKEARSAGQVQAASTLLNTGTNAALLGKK